MTTIQEAHLFRSCRPPAAFRHSPSTCSLHLDAFGDRFTPCASPVRPSFSGCLPIPASRSPLIALPLQCRCRVRHAAAERAMQEHVPQEQEGRALRLRLPGPGRELPPALFSLPSLGFFIALQRCQAHLHFHPHVHRHKNTQPCLTRCEPHRPGT